MHKDEKKKASINRPLLLTLFAATFALGVFAGTGMGLFSSSTASRSEAVSELTDGTFRFIRASVEARRTGQNRKTRELKPFQYKVNALIENSINSGDIAAASVYFRDNVVGAG